MTRPLFAVVPRETGLSAWSDTAKDARGRLVTLARQIDRDMQFPPDARREKAVREASIEVAELALALRRQVSDPDVKP